MDDLDFFINFSHTDIGTFTWELPPKSKETLKSALERFSPEEGRKFLEMVKEDFSNIINRQLHLLCAVLKCGELAPVVFTIISDGINEGVQNCLDLIKAARKREEEE